MIRTICMTMALLLLVTALTACGRTGKQTAAKDTPAAGTEQAEGKTVKGIINKIDNYLMLLTEEEEYQVMDYGEGVTMDGFAEGDKVEVTYTGTLGSESSTPVIVAIEKME